jgi:hypothetical protein
VLKDENGKGGGEEVEEAGKGILKFCAHCLFLT